MPTKALEQSLTVSVTINADTQGHESYHGLELGGSLFH